MGEIYISAFTADFRDYDRLMDWIRSFSGLTIGAELAAAWPVPDFYQRLEPQIPRFREIPTTIHGPFIEMCTQPGSPEEQRVNAELEYCCRLYQQLNARSIVLHTHAAAVPTDRQDWARERIVEVLSHWIRVMTDRGMAVTVENVGYPGKNNALFPQEQFIALFERLPEEAGCLIDIGHALLNGWDIPGLVRSMGTKIRGYHIHNNNGLSDSHVPIYAPGSVYSPGQMDTLLKTMAEVTPDAHLILEYSPRVGVTREILHEDIRAIAAFYGMLPG